MKLKVVVLYEDRRGATKGFGPHDLLLACVADELGEAGQDLWVLAGAVDGRPQKGIPKLLAACRDDMERLTRNGERVFALVDDNGGVRRALGLGGGVPSKVVLAALKMAAPSDKLQFFLLHRNVESLVDAVRACLGKERVERKPTPDERDIELSKAAWNERFVRDCVRQRVPALDDLVHAVVRVLSP